MSRVADETSSVQLARWISYGTSIVAPATVLSTLLFYFGYVSSRAQYEYFGIDVDTTGLSTQDYVMRSPQPLLTPLLVLTLLGIGGLVAHRAVRRRIVGAESPEATRRYERLARRGQWLGTALVGAGVVLLGTYSYLRDWALFSMVTPLLLAAGSALIGYSARTRSALRSTAPAPADPASVMLRRSITALVFVLVVANVFWATATLAQWSGRGLARYGAGHLDRLPSVILDTHERMFLRDPGVQETALPAAPGQTFRYRYRHLRLLIVGHDRLFLVPERWSASDSTLVVPMDGSVRVQFQFQNDAP